MRDHVPVFSTMDLVRMLFGVLIVAAGAVSCLFFAVRRSKESIHCCISGWAHCCMAYGFSSMVRQHYMHGRVDRITQ